MPSTPKIVTRSETTSSNTVENLNKGSKLTFAEMDSNFLELRNGSIGIVGDDSTGIDLAHGSTLKVAGTGGIATAVSGDTLTIDASSIVTTSLGDLTAIGSTLVSPSNAAITLDPSGTGTIELNANTNITGDLAVSGSISGADITFVGDDSTGTNVNIGETFKVAGTQNVSTAVSGDTLTITGPDLTGYLTTETDPVVGAINGIVKANGAGTISAAVAGTDYLVMETNDLTSAVTWANVPDANITQSSVTQHQAALSITESQISDLQSYITDANLTIVGDDSTGVTFSAKNNDDITITGTGGITSTVSGNTVTIDGSAVSVSNIGDLKVSAFGTYTEETFLNPSVTDANLILGGNNAGVVAINDELVIMQSGTTIPSYNKTTFDLNGLTYIGINSNGNTWKYTIQSGTDTSLDETTIQLAARSVLLNNNINTDIIAPGGNGDFRIQNGGDAGTKGVTALSVGHNYITLTDNNDGEIIISPKTGKWIQADGIKIQDNTISTNESNADLELDSNGTGNIIISGLQYPNTDGVANQILGTNGSGVISFVDPTAINIDGGTADSIYTSVPTIDGGTA